MSAEEEEDLRANAVLEAMVLLDTPNIDQLRSEEVYKCFRRATLLHHPDKLPPSATDNERDSANKNFILLVMARDQLLLVMDDPNHLTSSLKKKIKKGFLKARKFRGVYNLEQVMKECQKQGRDRAIEYHKMEEL